MKSRFSRRVRSKRPVLVTAAAAAGATLVGAAAFGQSLVTLENVLDVARKLGAFDLPTHPYLERAEQNEAESIEKVAATMFRIQMAREPQSRDAHAKGHGCAIAEFRVRDDIPAELREGLFARGGEKLPAIIRFSNGAGSTQPDGTPDGRGMAVKVLGGAPNGNLLGTGTTQDFMMVNGPRFFIRSIGDYAKFEGANLRDKNPKAFFLERAVREALADSGAMDARQANELSDDAIQPILAALTAEKPDPRSVGEAVAQSFPHDAGNVLKVLGAKLAALKAQRAPLELRNALEVNTRIASSLNESYFSMSAYLLASSSGERRDTAVKYSVHPVDCKTGAPVAKPAAPETMPESALREQLEASLGDGARCFDFSVQMLPTDVPADKQVELVEDPRLNFGTREIPIARITLPRQHVDSKSKQEYCENLSYNPWQAGASHRPLGGLNRVRKVAVTASSIRRHLVRGAQRLEPSSLDEYLRLK